MINQNNKIFIFTHYLYMNFSEYKNYVLATNYNAACIKLFNYWISEKGFEYYCILSMFVNYFNIDNDEITALVDNNNQNRNTRQIIDDLLKKYLQDENISTIFNIIDYHVSDKNRMRIKKKHDDMHHHITHMTCEELDDQLIK